MHITFRKVTCIKANGVDKEILDIIVVETNKVLQGNQAIMNEENILLLG